MRIKSEEKKIKVRMQMGRDNNRQWRLSIEDQASGLIIVNVSFDHEQLSNLLSTMTTEPCDADYYGDKNIGKRHENKTVQVNLKRLPGVFESYDEKTRTRDLRQVYDLAEEDNPGWEADRDEKFNNYRMDRANNTYSVIIRRYVKDGN